MMQGLVPPNIDLTSPAADRYNSFIAMGLVGQGSLVNGPAGNGSTWIQQTSTYAGWGMALPATSGKWNRISFPIIAWNAASIPTQVRIVIKQTNQSGTVLATIRHTLPQPTYDTTTNATNFRMFLIDATLNATMNGAAADTYWLEYYGDGISAPQSIGTSSATQQMYTTSTSYKTALVNSNNSSNHYPVISFYLTACSSLVENGTDNGMVDIPPTYTTSNSFSSYGFPMGNGYSGLNAFNALKVDINWTNLAVTPPSAVRFIIRDGGPTLPTSNPTSGPVLADATVNLFDPYLPVPFVNGTVFGAKVFLPQDVNTPNYLWLEVITDSHIAIRSSTNSLSYGQNYTFGTAKSLTSEPTSVAASNLNAWFVTYYYDRSAAALAPAAGTQYTTQWLNQLVTYIRQNDQQIYSCLTPKIYSASGRQCNIYLKNILRTGRDLTNFKFNFVCTTHNTASFYTNNGNPFWQYTMTDSDVGSLTWTCNISDSNGVFLTSITTTIVVSATNAGGAVTRQVVTPSDSKVANGLMLSELMNLNASTYTGMTVSLLGETTVSNIPDSGGTNRSPKTDAVSGQTMAYHVTNKLSSFTKHTGISITSGGTSGTNTVTLSSVTGIVVGTWIWMDGGTGELALVTNVSGSVLTLSQNIVNSSHTTVYWFSWAAYVAANSYTINNNDWVLFADGTNDFFNLSGVALYQAIAQYRNYLQSAINNILSVNSGMRIGLCLVEPTADQDTFGPTYPPNQTADVSNRAYQLAREQMLTWFAGQPQVFIVPINVGIDTRHNFPWEMLAPNVRNALPSVNWTPGTVSQGTPVTITISDADAAVGMPVTVAPPAGFNSNLVVDGVVTGSQTITLRIKNTSSSPVAAASGVYTAILPTTQMLVVGNNGVHEANDGYWQIADQYMSFLLAQA